jgi:hypothetical protein
MKMITKLRRLKLLLHLEKNLWIGTWRKYLIIVEEYGLIGGLGSNFIFIVVLIRW